MSVALAYAGANTPDQVIRLAAREALLRETTLEVVHVSETLDADKADAITAGITERLDAALGAREREGLQWHPALIASEEPAEAILVEVKVIAPDLLVIGARRRSPVGKVLLGSKVQTILLAGELPVLVVPT